jgi:L-malate glycosyltransferase
MRILHLLASPFFSGPAENVALLAQAQAALGHEVRVAVDRKRPGLSAEEPIVPRLRALGLLDGGGLELSVKSTPWALVRDLRRLRARSEDVVHAHFTHDHLLARWGQPRGSVLVRSLHAPRSLRRSLPRADAYTVFTPHERERLQGRCVLQLSTLVDARFVPPVDRGSLRGALGLRGEPLVGMVSTFQPSRRHALGVAAFAQLRRARPGAHLVLVGDGGLQGAVRAQVQREGLEDAVTFAGYQSGEAFVRWLQVLDEVWLLGLGNDWSGRAAAQARACGVRVVAVAEGALPTLADAEVTALEPEALVAASLSGARAQVPLRSNREAAEAVCALYEDARRRR